MKHHQIGNHFLKEQKTPREKKKSQVSTIKKYWTL